MCASRRAEWPLDIAAIVTVTDDGGSSGRLRREFRRAAARRYPQLPVALSEDEGLLSRLSSTASKPGAA